MINNTREEEFEKVKEIIINNYKKADCGLYTTRNIVGDEMTNLFTGTFFQVDICYFEEYFEVFGLNENEFNEIWKLYLKVNPKAYIQWILNYMNRGECND